MATKKKIYFITSNKNKYAEVKEIMNSDHFDVEMFELELPEYQGTPMNIALGKYQFAKEHLPIDKYPFMIEDTGLHFNALNGLPGPYIKWFLEKLGLDGLNKMLYAYKDKTAYAQCIVTMAVNKDDEPITFVGVVPGVIVPSRGETKFGWDPIFEIQVADDDLTFAEMDIESKNKLSHRAKAFKNAKHYLESF